MNRHGVVVGVDDGKPAHDALTWACREAKALGEKLTIVHATALVTSYVGVSPLGMVPPPTMESCRQYALEVLDDAVATARLCEPTVTIASSVQMGPPGQELCEHSKNARAVVVGRSTAGSLARFFMGSVARFVLHRSSWCRLTPTSTKPATSS
jgi:nucleotide-binding universal stress UspA family protein